jgi:hypothetical protein
VAARRFYDGGYIGQDGGVCLYDNGGGGGGKRFGTRENVDGGARLKNLPHFSKKAEISS